MVTDCGHFGMEPDRQAELLQVDRASPCGQTHSQTRSRIRYQARPSHS
jgi:hypothetical protein